MCWNERVSLNSFIFSLFALMFAYFNNVINIYLFLYIFSFTSMQLLEYFTWRNLNDKKINKLLSQLGLFLIFIQPILAIIAFKNIAMKIKIYLIVLYLMFAIFCHSYFHIDFSMEKAPNGHLAWNWLNFPPLIIFIWLSFIFGILLYRKLYLRFSLHLIVFIAIYYTYYTTNTWGSLWCWIANIIALQLIFQVFFQFKLNNCLLFESRIYKN